MQHAPILQGRLPAHVLMDLMVMEHFVMTSMSAQITTTMIVMPMPHAKMMYLDHILASAIQGTKEMAQAVQTLMNVKQNHVTLMPHVLISQVHLLVVAKQDFNGMAQFVVI